MGQALNRGLFWRIRPRRIESLLACEEHTCLSYNIWLFGLEIE